MEGNIRTVFFPYGKEFLKYEIPESRFRGELLSRIHDFRAEKSQEELKRVTEKINELELLAVQQLMKERNIGIEELSKILSEKK